VAGLLEALDELVGAGDEPFLVDQDAVHVHQVGLDRSMGGHEITRFRYGERQRGGIAGWPRSADGASGGARARSGLGRPWTWRWPDPRATRRAGPPPLAVEPQLLGVLAEGGDQLVLAHRRAAFEPRGARVAAAPVSDHRALVVELDIAAS
jgi:hypothetical protein